MEKAPEGAPLPVVTFFQPREHQVLVLYSQQTCSEKALKRFLPKSHLAKVIIQDNVSVQRVQEIKKQQIEGRKKKAENLLDQMKRRFLQNQQKKTFRWMKEYSYYQKMLEEIDQRNQMRELGSTLMMKGSQSSSAKPSDKTGRLR
ncbi:uncharacterized protein C5orf52 homolog [Pantherophis guttatus]|uniref:Uncharacterized protein C5orf52 homolog n=1 Tax=Pantherophis guttatus TaxID=94885 RepID=A0A6P9CJF7_PANGU|nr:uncharacterized protein C5orf52 homolog [Pantherophis guttatus]